MDDFQPEIPDEYGGAHEAALQLSQDANFQRAFGEVVADPRLAAKAAEDPVGFLSDYGVKVPDGLTVTVPGFGKPGPDWVPFTIRLTNCRTYRRRNRETGQLEEAEICRGFEIMPHGVPGGPWG